MIVTILGSGSNGGVPQWDCCCPNCTRARKDPCLRRTRSSVTVSLDGGKHTLFDATPDLKFQLERTGITPRPHTAFKARENRIDSVFLTHGHGDHTVGIAEFSTGKSFRIPIYAPPDLVQFLFGSQNKQGFFGEIGRLAKDYVIPKKLMEGATVELFDGLRVEGFEVPHTHQLEDGTFFPSKTYGYEISDGENRFVYTPDIGLLTDDVLERAEGAALFMLDATFWWDDELARISGIEKTSYELGHVPVEESIQILSRRDIGRIVYTHLNHTNPLLDSEEPMMDLVRKMGVEIAHDGMIIEI
ncbi:MAG: MBL fold metallo-hydrolase [Candidatus Bathyarchaeota archaeon]|jgi:pyrroloquinoline quinone biosynthesis protein B